MGDVKSIPEGAEVEVLGDAHSGYIVNVAREIGEEAVRVPCSISAKLKVHQVSIHMCIPIIITYFHLAYYLYQWALNIPILTRNAYYNILSKKKYVLWKRFLL